MNISNNTIVNGLNTTGSSASINLGGSAESDMITKPELCKCLNYSERTLQRMVERFELPPAMTLCGRKVWIVGKIRAWFADATERRDEGGAETASFRYLTFSYF